MPKYEIAVCLVTISFSPLKQLNNQQLKQVKAYILNDTFIHHTVINLYDISVNQGAKAHCIRQSPADTEVFKWTVQIADGNAGLYPNPYNAGGGGGGGGNATFTTEKFLTQQAGAAPDSSLILSNAQ